MSGIASLEAACGAVDGGRLKLEYGTLRSRPAGVANDFLWLSAEGEVVGFCGIYQNRPTEVEICGMVHPDHRRRHIGTRLLDAAMDELRRRGVARVLLIVDRSCEAGVGFAAGRGGTLESSEYRMRQEHAPELQGAYKGLVLRPVAADDVEFVRDCTARGFELPAEAVDQDDWEERARQTLVIESAGTRVGVMRVDRDEVHDAGIYGFVVVPELQGRGYGRGALSTITRAVRTEGVESVHLEVLVDNPAALHLYESCGFVSSGVEDYYLIER